MREEAESIRIVRFCENEGLNFRLGFYDLKNIGLKFKSCKEAELVENYFSARLKIIFQVEFLRFKKFEKF